MMTKMTRSSGMPTAAIFRLGLVLAVLVVAGVFTLGVAYADPPEGQTYTGAKKCAACHFQQYMSWKKTKHAGTFLVLPEKYKKDPQCLKCHTTGYGEPSGFKDVATTPALAGNTCETCHGPGSKHEEIAKPFAQTKTLTEEQEKLVRGSIWLMVPKNVCVECHQVQGHGKRVPFDKE